VSTACHFGPSRETYVIIMDGAAMLFSYANIDLTDTVVDA